MVKRWEELESEIEYTCSWFQVKRSRLRSPRTGEAHNFYSLVHHDCVNVIALTPQMEIVLIRQYRYTTNTLHLETPGGVIDGSDPSPLEAARRELKEETGFISGSWHEIGSFHPNPAVMGSRCSVFLALNAEEFQPQHLDATEDIEIVRTPLSSIPEMIDNGEISHGMVLSALLLFEFFRARNPALFSK
jgi:8-oxo-dGTP pyrophosphatase MutT (NUDIX family)